MILTIGPGGSGLTFLNWTILFLKGCTTYTTLDKKVVDVDINPLKDRTAHKFSRDHLQASVNLSQIELASNDSVIYCTPSHQQDFDYLAKYNCKKIVFNCQDKHKELFARMITCMPDSRLPNFLNSLAGKFGMDESKQVLLDHSKIFTNYYTVPNSSNEYWLIGYDDIFSKLDTKLDSLFLFLGFTIDKQRLAQWTKIYEDYKSRNKNILEEFAPNYGFNVPATVKNQIIKELIKWKQSSHQFSLSDSIQSM